MKEKRMINNYGMLPYLFIAPGLLLFVMIALIPILEAFFLSFTNWDGVMQLPKISFVGLNNYRKVLTSSIFYISIKNNLIWALVSVTIPIALGLVQAAVIINSRVKGKNLFQLLLFLPQILSSMIMSVMWLAIYDPANGLVNSLLEIFHLQEWQRAWLGDSQTALFCLLIMSIWAGYGFNTILYCTALRSIDAGMYEAAKVDGATSLQRFFYITIPAVKGTTLTLILLALINAFKIFDTVYQMTEGGPGYYTYVLSYYLYSTAFKTNKIGLGCAIAILQTILVLGISGFFSKMSGEQRDE